MQPPDRNHEKRLSPLFLQRAALFFFLFMLVLPMSFVTLLLFSRTRSMIDRSNQATAHDHVLYQAILTARDIGGPYGVAQFTGPALTFLDHGLNVLSELPQPVTAEQEAGWIASRSIRTIVMTNVDTPLLKPLPNWVLVKQFHAEARDEQIIESSVYVIP